MEKEVEGSPGDDTTSAKGTNDYFDELYNELVVKSQRNAKVSKGVHALRVKYSR